MGLKWDSQLITQIWKLIYRHWIHHSKLNHTVEALDNHTKELIPDAEIIDKHELGQETIPYWYNPYFITLLSPILDT